MLFGSTCIDNFFNDPYDVLDLAEKCKYNKDRKVPGLRSEPLHITHYDFYKYLNLKILNCLYPNEVNNIQFKSVSLFQKIPSSMKYDGWVHKDEDKFLTSIIYLSASDAGTSLFKPKNNFFIPNDLDDEKHAYFWEHEKYQGEDLERIKINRSTWNNSFEETVRFKGEFNRMICFDGNEYHAAQIHNGPKDRLTLITFFDEITLNNKSINFPLPTLRRR